MTMLTTTENPQCLSSVRTSDVRGVAASPPALIVGVGDSITYGIHTSDPPATSYLARTAALLGVPHLNLGIPGANSAGVGTEVASIPPDAPAIVVYAGTNDVTQAVGVLSSPSASVEHARFLAPYYDKLIALVRARAPAARLVMLTVRDFGRAGTAEATPSRFTAAALTAAVREWNAHVRTVAAQAGPRARVLDLETDPQWYDPAEYDGAGIHPNDAGAARLARAVAAVLVTA